MELYYFNDDDSISARALFMKFLTSPLFGVIISNYMPKKIKSFIPYLIGWVVFSTFFEWLTVKFDYLTYTGWKLWYSFIFYIFAVTFMRWNLFFIRKR